MWTIYSIGDSYFLSAILNAIAMIFNSHIPDALVAIGLLLGYLYQSYRSILSISSISLTQIFAAFFIYILFFVPKAEVCVFDVYSSEVREVDNVPLGVASAGAIISNIGFVITEQFNDAFANVESTDRGFASSLVIISKLRKDIDNLTKLKEINEVNNGNFSKSWLNYIKECTLIGVDLGSLKVSEIFLGGNIFEALRFDSQIYGTSINTNGNFENQTCSDAYVNLTNYSKGIYSQNLDNKLSNNVNCSGSLKNDSIYGSDLNSALDSLGITSVRAQEYVLGTILLPIFEESAKTKYQNEHAYNASIMLEDAIIARNTQWTAEQSMFFTTIRPIITFFEGVVYALTPIMVFVLALGLTGFAMLGKYLLILIWIELWQPLLAIINFYIIEAAKGNLALTNYQDGSFLGIITTQKIIAEYLAIGGMLSAAVPALSLMVIYAGVVSASSFTSRLAGADHIKEGISTPTITNSPSIIDTSSLFKSSSLGGIYKNEAKGYLPELSLSSSFDKALSSARSNVKSAENSFATSLAQTQTDSLSHSLNNTKLEQIGESVGKSKSKSASMLSSYAKNISEKLNLSSSEQSSLRGALNASFNGSSLTSKDLASLVMSKSSSADNTIQLGKLSNEIDSLAKNNEIRNQYQRALSEEISKGITDSISHQTSKGLNSQLLKSAQNAQSAREELSFLESNASKITSNQSLDGTILTKAIASDENQLKALQDYGLARNDVSKRAYELMPLMNSLLPSQRQAYVASMLTAMQEIDPQNAFKFMSKAAAINPSKVDDKTKDLQPNIIDTNLNIDLKEPQNFEENKKGSLVSDNLKNNNLYENKAHFYENNDLVNKADATLENTLNSRVATVVSAGSYIQNQATNSSDINYYQEGLDLGLTPAQSRVYESFSKGESPKEKDLKELFNESSSNDIYKGTIQRIYLGAKSEDKSVLSPVTGHKEK